MKSGDVLEKVPLTFIGAGAMGEAMIGGLLAKRLVAPGAITAADRHAERLEVVRRRFHIHTTRDNRAAVRKARIVVLSVKPQVLPVVLSELRGDIPASALVLSIVAGARIELMTRGARPHGDRAFDAEHARAGRGRDDGVDRHAGGDRFPTPAGAVDPPGPGTSTVRRR